MSDEPSTGVTRRAAVGMIAGAGVAGLSSQSALAGEERYENTKLGPLADVPESKKFTFDEYERVLESEDNGYLRVTRGSVRDKEVFVGDNRTASVAAMEQQLTGDITADQTFDECVGTAWYLPEVCFELTVEVQNGELYVEFIAGGYPIFDTTIGLNASASFDFSIPYIPGSGTITLSAEVVSTCSVNLSAELSGSVFGIDIGSVSLGDTFSYC